MNNEHEQPVIPDYFERRSFLTILIGLGTAAVGALLSVPLFRYAFHPLLAKTTEVGWSPVGTMEEFTLFSKPIKRVIDVEQRDGWRKVVSKKAVYVVRKKDGKVGVVSPVCPHLGCPISWSDEKNLFICPCHDGVFSPDGAKISGPPPRGMDDLEINIQNNKLMVRYQYFRSLVPTKEVMG